jgi:thiamine monophosphate kinase
MREFELLAHVFRDNARLPAHVTVPPGDDMAVVEMCADPGRLQLTVGVTVEAPPGNSEAWESLGRRAMCGSGPALGSGGCSVVGVVLPSGIAGALALALHAGLRDESDRIGAPIVGGDVAVSQGPRSSETVICAAQLRAGAQDRQPLLIACDSAIEGRHAPHGCDPFLIGRKAVLRNISDVAAMGNAVPLAIAAGIVLPRGCPADRRARLVDGIRQAGERWRAPLVAIDEREHIGPDPDAPLIACVAIVAGMRAASSALALRSDARPGDGV